MTRAYKTELLLRFLQENPHVGADLHTHTTVSDGSDTCREVLEQGLRNGLSFVAITNHDTTAALDEAYMLGAELGIGVIGGIEVSAWDEHLQCKVHVLGYGLQSESPALEALCAPTRARRNKLSCWALARLVDEGFPVDEALAYSLSREQGVLYKQHIMAALTDAPFSSDAYQQLYAELFKGSGMCAGDIAYVDACDAVEAIVEDGGVAVLAHPGQQGNYDIVPRLVECGLCGIEKFHPAHGEGDWERCDAVACDYDLVCTAGSDYHGRFGGSALRVRA